MGYRQNGTGEETHGLCEAVPEDALHFAAQVNEFAAQSVGRRQHMLFAINQKRARRGLAPLDWLVQPPWSYRLTPSGHEARTSFPSVRPWESVGLVISTSAWVIGADEAGLRGTPPVDTAPIGEKEGPGTVWKEPWRGTGRVCACARYGRTPGFAVAAVPWRQCTGALRRVKHAMRLRHAGSVAGENGFSEGPIQHVSTGSRTDALHAPAEGIELAPCASSTDWP